MHSKVLRKQVEYMNQAVDLFTKLLCGPMFQAQASVVIEFKGSKSGTMIDRDKRKPFPYFTCKFFEGVYWCALQLGLANTQ